MSNTKHTPGPWRMFERYGGEMACAIEAGENQTVCETIGSHYEDGPLEKGEAIANAKLIAAAPELLEALETLVRVLEYDPDLMQHFPMDMAYAAIKKATE